MRIVEEIKNYPPISDIFDLYKNEKNAVFLDSSLQNKLGRYSIIGIEPYLEIVDCEPEELRQYINEHQDKNETDLPIVSGAIGYFSYDYGRERMGIVSRHEKEVDIPECVLVFYDIFIIEDHSQNRLFVVANGNNRDPKEQINDIRKAIESLAYIKKSNDDLIIDKTVKYELTSNFVKEDYLQAVNAMINYIIEGDIYIVNMTQSLAITSGVKPYSLFRKLRESNPSPFGGYFNYGDFEIVCASPERFMQMKNRVIETRPIKGTRKRGDTKEEDDFYRDELKNSEKDKSELLMIVDLERNDLNRVCVPGSVKVTEMFTIEEYATVFHLVSNITGKLKEDLNIVDLLEAAFPGGSITGAPKYRAMELIDKVENSRRNLYTGCIGYITLDSDCDLNIVIRTAVYKDGVYHLGVGGGITCESDLEFEYEETLQKAKALVDILKEGGENS